jgi:hypothetical protein
MNYQTKLAAAANDYELGLRVAKLASEQLVFPGMEPTKAERAHSAVNSLLDAVSNSRAADAARNYVEDIKKPLLDPQQSLPGIGPSKAQQIAGHRGVQTAGALAGLGGLGAAGVAGVNAYKRHKRNQLLKRIGMGAGGAALLGGGGLLAHRLMSDDE